MIDVMNVHQFAQQFQQQNRAIGSQFHRVLKPGDYNADGSMKSDKQRAKAARKAAKNKAGGGTTGPTQTQPSHDPMDFNSSLDEHPFYQNKVRPMTKEDYPVQTRRMKDMVNRAQAFDTFVNNKIDSYRQF